MVFVQRDKAPPAPASAPAPVLPAADASYIPATSLPIFNDNKGLIRVMVPAKPYVVPADGKNHEIRITVVTAEGSHGVYMNQHRGGEKVRTDVFIKKSERIRFYDNDALVGEVQL